MLRRMNAKSKRITAGLLGFLILAAALFSAVFIAVEADHDCTSENCPVCACIRLCMDFLSRLLPKAFGVAHTVLPAVCVLLAALVFYALVKVETPVSRKVRLNH